MADAALLYSAFFIYYDIIIIMPEELVPAEKPQIIRKTQLRYKEVISRLVYHGQSIKDIAAELGFSESGLYRITRSPLFQMELQKELNIKQKMERDSVLQSVANEAAKKLKEAITTGKMTFTETDENGVEVKRAERVLDGREIVAIAHDALNRTGHRGQTEQTAKVEQTINLGQLIINAHKKNEEGVLDRPEDAIDVEIAEPAGD